MSAIPAITEENRQNLAANTKKRKQNRESMDRAEEFTDLGASVRLTDEHAHELRHSAGRWLTWDGCRWAHDEGQAQEMAKASARAALLQVADTENNKLISAAARQCAAPRIRAALQLASSDPVISVAAAELDADRMALNVHNGTLDLTTGNLKPHDPADLNTKLAGAEYHPDARSEVWERFLDQSTGGDTDLATLLQRIAGYTLTGLTREEIVPFLHGPGDTGKTTFVETIAAVLGDYARTMNAATLLAVGRRDGSNATPDVAELQGARMAHTSEVSPNQKFDPERLKSLTGGDKITARVLYGNPIEFLPQFTIWIAANDVPGISAHDTGAWRRLRLVPFSHVVPVGRLDDKLKNRLTTDPEQLAAVLAWAVRGCIDWQRDGLGQATAVTQATADHRGQNDPLAEWIVDRCTTGEGHRAMAADLYRDYEEWARLNGEDVIKPAAFAQSLKSHGATPVRTKRARGWNGISIGSTDTKGDGVTGCDGGNRELPHTRAHEESFRTTPSPAVTPSPEGVEA